MQIESVEFTSKGWDYAKSRQRRTNNPDFWAVVYWLARMGGKARNDQIATYVFGGDERRANRTIGELKQQKMVEGY